MQDTELCCDILYTEWEEFFFLLQERKSWNSEMDWKWGEFYSVGVERAMRQGTELPLPSEGDL